MSDHEEPEYELVTPLVLARSNGGPYDDTALVAGMTCGALDHELGMTAALHALPQERWLDVRLLPQVSTSLRCGTVTSSYTVTSTPPDISGSGSLGPERPPPRPPGCQNRGGAGAVYVPRGDTSPPNSGPGQRSGPEPLVARVSGETAGHKHVQAVPAPHGRQQARAAMSDTRAILATARFPQ